MKWEEYLEQRGFKDDIVRGIEKQTHILAEGQTQAVRQIAAAQSQAAHETSEAFDRGFGRLVASQAEMTAVMRQGFDSMSYSLEKVRDGIEALHADFNWAMGAVLWKMEMQHATLCNILATLQAPLDTQAKELRQRAEDAYLNGWYEEALVDFLASEQKNYQDFAVHQAIGNIYLYKQVPANLELARQYYLKAAKYATPRSAYHAARANLHAAFVCYLQRDDAAALEHSRQAMQLYPRLSEAFYNHAKFAAAVARPELAIPALETAIRADRNYAVKARADADFENIAADITALLERLRDEARQKVETEAAWSSLRTALERFAIPPAEQAQLQAMRAEIESLLALETYFGYLDALQKIGACRKFFNSLRLHDRNRLLEKAIALAQESAAMANYILEDNEQQDAERYRANLEKLTTGVLTYAQVVEAVSIASENVSRKSIAWKSGREFAILPGHTETIEDLAFSPDGKLLASCARDKTVRLWDVANRCELAVLKGHTNWIEKVAFSPDSKMLASSESSTVRLWDVTSQQELEAIYMPGFGGKFALNPDWKILAHPHYDDTVHLFDMANREELVALEGHTETAENVAFSPDGKLLASCSRDNTVRLWDVANRSELAVLQGHTGSVIDIAFSPDGKLLASCSNDKTIRLWNVANRRELAVLSGHTDWVNDLAFSPDGKLLASCSCDYTIRLWDVPNRCELGEVMSSGQSSVVVFNPHDKGLTLATDGRLNTVRLWGLVLKTERGRIEQVKTEDERIMQQVRQRSEWRDSGRCEVCGARLGLFDKDGRRFHRCKKHYNSLFH